MWTFGEVVGPTRLGAHSLPTAETLIIIQPNYVSWIGYFDLVGRAQLCIWYDDVQYTKNDWRNRNRIAAGEGVRWITVPVLTRGHFGQAIRDVAIDWRQDWAKKHLKSFEQEYARAPALRRGPRALCVRARVPALLDVESAAGREASARPLHLRARRREGLPVRSGRPGHLDPRPFRERGMRLEYIVYGYNRYDRGRAPRDENLSILDTLAWLGAEGTAELKRRGRRVDVGT